MSNLNKQYDDMLKNKKYEYTKINNDIKMINEMVSDLNSIVNQQQHMFDNIDDNIYLSKEIIEEAEQDIRVADEKQTSNTKIYLSLCGFGAIFGGIFGFK